MCKANASNAFKRGLRWATIMATIIGVYLLFITFTCLACGAGGRLASRGASGGLSFQQVFMSPLDSKSRQPPPRSGAQFGVAPHLGTNFRVSRTPNRRTALPWQRLTAKKHCLQTERGPSHTANYSRLFSRRGKIYVTVKSMLFDLLNISFHLYNALFCM